MSDTTVTMSRAAEKPLPPPPPGTTWERIEWVREKEQLKYSEFSRLAKRSPAQYRNVATRGWGGRHQVVESFVQAVADLGYSRVWVLTGQGEPKPGARDTAKQALLERRNRRLDAIAKLMREEDIPEEDAERLVDEVGDKPTSRQIFDAALEEWELEVFRKQREEAREARRLSERSQTPSDPPSLDAIGKRRKVGVERK
jgi:hypothetical protein